MAQKNIMEEIAASIPDEMEMEEEMPMDGPVAGEVSVTDSDEDLSDLVPKDHYDDNELSVQEPMGHGDGEGNLDVAPSENTVPVGDTNAAPPTQESFAPSGVVKVDVPFLIKMMEHVKNGADIHKCASKCAEMCGDPSCSHLGMDHFEDFSSGVPVGIEPGMPGANVEGSPENVPAEMMGAVGGSPDGALEVEAEGEEVVPPESEAIEGEEPGADPVGEAEGTEPETEPETEESESKDKGGPPKPPKPPKKEGKKEADKEEPTSEGIDPIIDPLLEKFQPPTRQKAIPSMNKSDVVDEPEKGKGKGSKKKFDFEKAGENEEEALAESIDRLVKSMSTKSKLVFIPRSPNVTQFDAKPNPKFQRVLAESINKALKDKQWLVKNDLLSSLGKYQRASLVHTADMGDTHLLVLE